MKLSIIIVTYNSLHLIEDCIDSILKYNDIGQDLEIIIVDNDSPDQKELFKLINDKYDNEVVKVYNSGENGGYGKGNNFGISKTNADIVVVMNPDVRFITPILKNIMKEFENPEIGLVGVEFIDGSNPYYFKPEHDSLFHSIFSHFYTKSRSYDPSKMYMSGSIMAFDRKSFMQAGQYDEKIFMYYEEADITNRIIKIGKKVKWLKGVMVQHLAHGRKFNKKLTDIAHDSLEYYCQKYNIDIKKQYRIQEKTLKLKILLSKILKDNSRNELFSKTLESIQYRKEKV